MPFLDNRHRPCRTVNGPDATGTVSLKQHRFVCDDCCVFFLIQNVHKSESQQKCDTVAVAGVKPPVVVTPLQTVDTSEKGPAKFTAKITGYPEPVATW